MGNNPITSAIGANKVTPTVSKVHICPNCDAPTVWDRDTVDPSKCFCCRCGNIEEISEEALLA